MAKVTYNKLGLKAEAPIKTITWNEQMIEVRQHLPLNDRLELIEKTINSTVDENNYYNPCKLDVFKNIFMIEYYTNITFTDKQKEDVGKLYDSFYLTGLLTEIMNNIPEVERNYIDIAIDDTIKSVYSYKNSAMGIMAALKQDYNNVNFDMSMIENILKNNGEDLGFLKEIMNKLG